MSLINIRINPPVDQIKEEGNISYKNFSPFAQRRRYKKKNSTISKSEHLIIQQIEANAASLQQEKKYQNRVSQGEARLCNFVGKFIKENEDLGADLKAASDTDLTRQAVYKFNRETISKFLVPSAFGDQYIFANQLASQEVIRIMHAQYGDEDCQIYVQQKHENDGPNTMYDWRSDDSSFVITQLFQVTQLSFQEIKPLRYIKSELSINLATGDATISWCTVNKETKVDDA